MRPILTQLDFAVRWKIIFQCVPPKVSEIGPPRRRTQNESELSSRSIQSCFPLLLLQEIAVSYFSIQVSKIFTITISPIGSKKARHFFDPTGSSTMTIPYRVEKTFFFWIRWTIVVVFGPVGSKKCCRLFCDFLQLAPLEIRETDLDTSWRKPRLIPRRRKYQFPIFFGAKADANVIIGTFSTDCKSNCIRIGLIVAYLGYFFFVSKIETGGPRLLAYFSCVLVDFSVVC